MKQATLPSLYEITLDVSMHSGFSVIPLTGKRPPRGFNYSKYHTTRTTPDELEAWFKQGAFASYGILCGTISDNLFVLDFDSTHAYQDFATRFPRFALSYTVKTRRGFHVYLRSKTPLYSHKIPGGDLLGTGSLVVGAGSQIDDFRYVATITTSVYVLSEQELASLSTWTNQPTYQPISPTVTSSATSSTLSKLATHYNELAPVLGRNNALYQSARIAARTGINYTDTLSSLTLIHAEAPAPWPHTTETHAERLQEAAYTITSAYKRLDRRITAVGKNTGLPNDVREFLLNHQNSTITARLLDAFVLAGWLAGRVFTTQKAIELAAEYGLARSSVLAALSGGLSRLRDKQVFQTNSHSHKEDKTPDGDMDFGRLNRSGRKPNTYIVPDLSYLCSICGLDSETLHTPDPLTPEDIASEKAYRMALHRELIKRAAPELSMRWHASRLNVSTKTIQRYNKALGVIVTPIIGYRPLTWVEMEQSDLWNGPCINTPARTITPGRWIQNSAGQRHPALKGVGYTLLKKREVAVICKRLPSRFQLPHYDQLIAIYPCIWRRLDRAVPDWGGAVDAFPLAQHPVEIETSIDDKTRAELNTLLSSYTSMPQDLTIIKGLGEWRQTILNNAGINRFAHLAAADPDRIARLSGMGQYITRRQTEFWVSQAKALIRGYASAQDLKGWSFKDWRIYAFEKSRIESASPTLKRALASEFKANNWLKYGSDLPPDFIDLINT